MKAKKKLGRNYWSNSNSLIEAEKLAVFMVEECHLLWGDLLSYTWGRKDKRIEIPIVVWNVGCKVRSWPTVLVAI